MQVLEGLRYVHAKSVVHGDLKAQNVLFSLQPPLVAKIADFGSSWLEWPGWRPHFPLTQTGFDLVTRTRRAPELFWDWRPSRNRSTCGPWV